MAPIVFLLDSAILSYFFCLGLIIFLGYIPKCGIAGGKGTHYLGDIEFSLSLKLRGIKVATEMRKDLLPYVLPLVP